MIHRALPFLPPVRLAAALALALAALLPLAGRATAQDAGTWVPLPAAGAPSPRYAQAAVWTGREMIVWGGVGCSGGASCGDLQTFGDGAAYDPSKGRWRPISSVGAPSPRADASAVWTGKEMLVWGGLGASDLGDGAAYNPTTGAWRPLSTAGAPSPRHWQMTAWTGKELLIWGGTNGGVAALDDGAAYDPATDRWRPLSGDGAPAPHCLAASAWTGRAWLIWGGSCGPAEGWGRYDPAQNTWAPLPSPPGLPRGDYASAWTGQRWLLWGGSQPNVSGMSMFAAIGAAFDPATNAWTPLPTAGSPPLAIRPRGAWTGRELLVWGAAGTSNGDSEGAYSPATGAWRDLPSAGSPSPRCEAAVLWTGTQLLVWGGNALCIGVGQTPLANGAAYTPPAAPTCRFALGFAALHAAIPAVVGTCLDDEQHDPVNGDALQHTINGLLVWRKADNFTAFTDGYRTWVNGPHGLQKRLNSQRFSWGNNPNGLPVAP